MSDERSAGRPFKSIDWEKVNELLAYHCTGPEIAAELGIHRDTLYDRCLSEHGLIYSDYSSQKQQIGKGRLRKAQHDKAIKDKDSTMQIWLGKHWLDQKEIKEIKVDPEANENSSAIKEQIKLAREAIEKMAEKK